MKNKLTIAIAIGSTLLSFNAYTREPVGINDQLVDKTTGEPLIVLPQLPAIDMNSFFNINEIQTQASKPKQPVLPVIDLSGNTVVAKQVVPKIEYWTCEKDCNPVELLIYNSGNAELIDLDNLLNKGWSWLEKNHPNQPILQTKLNWVKQRDTLALQILQQHGDQITIEWLTDQYKLRIAQIDRLNLIPKN